MTEEDLRKKSRAFILEKLKHLGLIFSNLDRSKVVHLFKYLGMKFQKIVNLELNLIIVNPYMRTLREQAYGSRY